METVIVWVMLVAGYKTGMATVPGYYDTVEACRMAAVESVARTSGRMEYIIQSSNSGLTTICVPVNKETLSK